jgi:hypothetical protein
MAKAGKTEKKRGRRIWRLVRFVVGLLLLAAVSYVLIAGEGRFDLEGIKGALADLRGGESADEFILVPGYDSAFADLDGVLVTAGTLGFSVLGADGRQLARESFKMSEPLMASCGGYAAVYDAGGTDVRLLDRAGRAVSVETKYEIIAASVNKNGWTTLCTREGEGYKGSVTVYGPDGNPKYKWYSADHGYVLSAALSQDNKSLAVLSLNDAGSVITFLQLRSEDIQATFELAGDIILEIKYRPDGRLAAVSESSFMSFDGAGTGKTILDYSDKHLGGWAIGGDGHAALLLLDYGVGDSGSLVTYDASGARLGTASADSRCLSLSVNGGNTAVLWRGGLSLYGPALELRSEFDDAADIESVIARADGAALAIGRGVARVVKDARLEEGD